MKKMEINTLRVGLSISPYLHPWLQNFEFHRSVLYSVHIEFHIKLTIYNDW